MDIVRRDIKPGGRKIWGKEENRYIILVIWANTTKGDQSQEGRGRGGEGEECTLKENIRTEIEATQMRNSTKVALSIEAQGSRSGVELQSIGKVLSQNWRETHVNKEKKKVAKKRRDADYGYGY